MSSTTAKGDLFESRSYKLIEDAINAKKFGVLPEYSKIFRKKGYYSRDRGKEIIFDLSIEVWLPEATQYSFLFIVECKSYANHKVPVDDIEEFYAKVIQVAGLNVKGVFITDNTFQEGAYSYAKSKGLMLIEFKKDCVHNIVLHKTNRTSVVRGSESELESEKSNPTAPESFDMWDWEKELEVFINAVLNTSKANSDDKIHGLKRLSGDHIEKITFDFIRNFNEYALLTKGNISIDNLQSYLHKTLKVTLDFETNLEKDTKGNQILGYCDIESRTIYVDKSIINTSRFPFIFAHEVGHLVLHTGLTMNQKLYNDFKDSELNFKLGRYVLSNDRHWIEWQANKFASSLLMPKESVLYQLISYQTKEGIRNKGTLRLDEQPINRYDFYRTIEQLALNFKVSKKSMELRLRDLNAIIYDYASNLHWTNYSDWV